MNQSSVQQTTAVVEATVNPFALEVEIVPEEVGPAGRACITDDGCRPSCASVCTSSTC